MKFFRLSFILLFFITLGLFGIGHMHEQVHVEIFSSYGIDSHVEYWAYFPDFVTVAERPCPTDTNCELAHHINEVVGYVLVPTYISLAMILFFIVLQLEGILDVAIMRMQNEEELFDTIKRRNN